MAQGRQGMPAANQHKEVLRWPGPRRLRVGVAYPLASHIGRPVDIRHLSSPVVTTPGYSVPPGEGLPTMKSARKKRSSVVSEPTTDTPALTTFSSDLLTPEEERELLAAFWDCKSELVRLLLRQYPLLRANR